MKKILLISLAFIGINANAQYFQHLYGTSQVESVTDAFTTYSGGDAGYFMVGTSANNGAGNPGRELVVARADESGNVTCATCFVKSYKIWNTFSSACSNDYYTLNNAKCAERRNSTNCLYDGRFEVVTEMKVGSNNWLSYTELDQFGNIVYGPENIFVPGSAFALGAVTASADETSIYITGNVTNTKQIFILKFNLTSHSITWSKKFNITATTMIMPPPSSVDEYATDIIEDAANNRVIVVGRVEEVFPPFTNRFGLVLTANNATGAKITADVYGVRNTVVNTENGFNSIKNSELTAGGFVISGYSDKQGTVDLWALRLTSAFGVSWSKVVDYSYAASPHGTSEVGTDIVERLNTSSNYEYYQIGNVIGGNRIKPAPATQQDIVVYKLDASGAATNQFTYGDMYGNSGRVIGLAPTNGFAFFGERYLSSGDDDFFAGRAYFNGLQSTTCTTYINPSNTSVVGHGLFMSGATVDTSSLSTFKAALFGMGAAATNTFICDGTNTSGSNARVAPNNVDDNKYDNIKVGPNPTLQGTTTTTLFIEANEPEQVTVSVYDMLGKQIYSNDFTVKKGDNNLSIDLSANRLVHGMYSIKINGTTTNQSRMLLVE